jgi:23S rRNA (uracil1939-C5)-methyltransferase
MQTNEKTKPRVFGEVIALSDQGFGVVKSPDTKKIVFVRGVWVGECGLFEIESEEIDGRYAFGELVRLDKPSPSRREVACPHFGLGPNQCYGCPWIIVDYKAQLEAKTQQIKHHLNRLGISDSCLKPIWQAPEEFSYRRRAQLKTDGQKIGYAGKKGESIAPTPGGCLVLSAKLNKLFTKLEKQLPNDAWKPGPGFIWNFLDIDESSREDAISLNRRLAFAQVNAKQNEAMRRWLSETIDTLDVNPSETALELFCGSGNFTEILSKKTFAHINAIEVDKKATSSLSDRGYQNVNVHCSDLFRVKPSSFASFSYTSTGVVVANPPRAGLGKLATIGRHIPKLRAFLYISCNPQSFAHDAKKIIKTGFSLESLQALDQMPQTPHVELCALFVRAPV